MSSKEDFEKVAIEIEKVIQLPEFKEKALYRVDKYLWSILKTHEERLVYREEALARVQLRVLQAMKRKSSTELQAFLSDPVNSLTGYILVSLNRECMRQLVKWSSWDESGKRAARNRVELDSIYSQDVTELSSNYVTPNDTELSNELRQVDDMLERLGLMEGEITIIKQYLSGTTFVEMAKEQGGTPDKYRKIFSRAKKKARLEHLSKN